MNDPLGGDHATWLLVIVAAVFVAALGAAGVLYRRAARRAELEAIDELLEE